VGADQVANLVCRQDQIAILKQVAVLAMLKLQGHHFLFRHALLEEIAKDSSLSVDDRKFPVTGDDFEVYQDRRMIKQLVRIFIENSVKFTKEGSSITLGAEKFKDFYRLTVTDEGEGIPEEDIGKVFERFYVADKARTKDKAGSGLGLSIAKWIVETHGGTIKVDSALGRGTTMTVEYPDDEGEV
jgi:signal transduction histidine kinase